MKKILIIMSIVSVQFQFVYAQNTTAWIRTLDGPTHFWDEASSVAVDDSGNIFVTGIDLVGSFSYRDIMTAKYNSSGELQWFKTIDLSSNEIAYQVIVDHSGNALVSGKTDGYGFVLVKYNSAGDSLWTVFPGSTDIGLASAIAIDDSDNIYFTGGSTEHSLLAKYNSNGEQQWINYYSGPDDHPIYTSEIAIDRDDNIYVIGKEEISFLSFSLHLRKYSPAGDTIWTRILYDTTLKSIDVAAIRIDNEGNVIMTGERAAGNNHSVFIIKYDSAGVLKWIQQPIQNKPYADGRDLVVDQEGNIYAAGIFSNSTVSDINIITLKYNADGDSIWSAIYNGPGNNNDEVRAMTIDGLANIYLTGSTSDFINGHYNTNCLALMYDSNGAQNSIKIFDGITSGEDNGFAITVDKINNVIIAGRTNDSINNFDYLIIKYSQGLTEVQLSTEIRPDNFILYQNYPNPFNPSTKIRWQSPVSSHQTIKVFDVLGNEIATLVDEYRPAGSFEFEFNPASGNRNLASGIYFYQLRVGSFVVTRKMMLLR